MGLQEAQHPAHTLIPMPAATPPRPRSTLLTIAPPLDRLLRQLHPLHSPAPRRRRLRPRRSRPRDAPPPRLRHPLRQRHPLPRESPAPLLVDGRRHARLATLRRHLAPSPRRRRAHPALAHRPRPRSPRRSLRPPHLPHRPRRPLRRTHPALQLRHLPLHPHHSSPTPTSASGLTLALFFFWRTEELDNQLQSRPKPGCPMSRL